ncbi:MAG: cyclic nucleotide-binding domain-containing protein [Polyangiaceae bacterium]
MRDVQGELFLAGFGARLGSIEPWVTDRITGLLEDLDSRSGETLFVAGDPPDFYYFLREGRVELVRERSAPWTYEGPSVFGLSDALLYRPRQRTAIALTDIQAMRVQSEAWLELLEDSFALARAALFGSISTVADLEQRLWAARVDTSSRSAPLVQPGAELDVIERLAVLAEAPLLRGAGVQTLSDLAAESETIAFARGEVLIERGKPPGRVVLLLEGEIDASREKPQARWRGGPGDIVCGTAAFGEAILGWEARARTPGRALTFRVADWLDLIEEHFDMVRKTLGALSRARDDLVEELR